MRKPLFLEVGIFENSSDQISLIEQYGDFSPDQVIQKLRMTHAHS